MVFVDTSTDSIENVWLLEICEQLVMRHRQDLLSNAEML